ncbi:MAG: hypothetical protein PHV68_00045 [Candidatus Gastranaerophilales bacterium]|nr:hypothetical protein [Candidatus Gastranaerophilales bacterium]
MSVSGINPFDKNSSVQKIAELKAMESNSLKEEPKKDEKNIDFKSQALENERKIQDISLEIDEAQADKDIEKLSEKLEEKKKLVAEAVKLKEKNLKNE